MKLFKLSLIAVVAALVVGTGTVAHAGSINSIAGGPTSSLQPAGAVSVPDASGTLSLFICALIALGTCKRFLRGPAAPR